MCDKIDRKQRLYAKHKADYSRWSQDPVKYRFSLEKALEEMRELAEEIKTLHADKDRRYMSVGNPRRN